MNVHPLRARDHEDAARVSISWLAERHRKGWRSAFESLLDLWRPEGPRDGWQLDEDGMTMVSINAGEWLISRGEINARGGPCPSKWCKSISARQDAEGEARRA